MAYLVDHPPKSRQFRPRRQRPSGVAVVHTAENTPDFVAFDGGAEAVARFIQGRPDPGSYHDLVDSDSAIQLVPYDCEAFHDGTGSNPHSYGLSIATRADVWPIAPPDWQAGAIEQAAQAAARYARWLRDTHGIVIPPRRITRAESDRKIPGFISHAERDPGRRSDPGAGFPWDAFLSRFANLLNGTPEPAPKPPEEDDMPAAIEYRTVYLTGSEKESATVVDPVNRVVYDMTGTEGTEFARLHNIPLIWVGARTVENAKKALGA